MKYLIFFAFFGVISAELMNIQPCAESPQCNVRQVHMDPCKLDKHGACKLKKGTVSTMTVDFTPEFSSEKIKAGLFWASDSGDVEFPDLYRADGCQYTSCPLEASKEQTFTYSLRLGKKLPNGRFLFKLKLWDETDDTKSCCYKTEVVLSK